MFYYLLMNYLLYIINFFRFTTDFDNRMREVALEDKEPSVEHSYMRTDWQVLNEMGPYHVDIVDPYDIHFDKDYWKNLANRWSTDEIDRLIGWIDSNRSADDVIMEDCPVVHPHQLNCLQRLAFEIVKFHNINSRQLLLIIIGAAGSGKTFTIHAISSFLKDCLKRSAPTAKAAFLINGDTVHQLFGLRVNDGRVYRPLEGQSLRKLQDEFEGITHVIIDEYSMISQIMLARIDLRMRQIAQKLDQYFGGLSVILTGDPAQLPPVCATCLYDKKLDTPLVFEGFTAYQKFLSVIQLTQIMRQQDDGDTDQRKFIGLLSRFRNGDCTLEDYNHLKKRFTTPQNSAEFADTTRIFALNETCDEHNKSRLESLGNPITRFAAKNTPSNAKFLNPDSFRGLKNTICLCIGAKVYLILIKFII